MRRHPSAFPSLIVALISTAVTPPSNPFNEMDPNQNVKFPLHEAAREGQSKFDLSCLDSVNANETQSPSCGVLVEREYLLLYTWRHTSRAMRPTEHSAKLVAKRDFSNCMHGVKINQSTSVLREIPKLLVSGTMTTACRFTGR